MAHIKALRQRWLAQAAQEAPQSAQPSLAPPQSAQGQQPVAAAPRQQHDQPPQRTVPKQQQQALKPPSTVLLPKKRLLEAAGAGGALQQDGSLPVKKQRQGETGGSRAGASAVLDAPAVLPAASAPSQQQRAHKPASRLNSDAKPRPEARPGGGKPAPGNGGAKPAKSERGGTKEGKETAGGKKEPGSKSTPTAFSADKATAKVERPAKKEAAGDKPAAKKEAAAERLAAKKDAAGERPAAKKDAAAERSAAKKEAAGDRPAAKKEGSRAAGDKPAKARPQGVANGRPAKPAAAADKAAAAKPAAAGPLAALKQEQQQEHAGSNPSSMRGGGGVAAEPRNKQQQQQQPVTSPARPPVLSAAKAEGIKAEREQGSSSMGTPVEVLLAPSEPAQLLGELVVTVYRGHGELWEAVRSRFADRLPSGGAAGAARLVYQDSDGDWLLLQPEAPWQLFQQTVRKLVVQATARPKQAVKQEVKYAAAVVEEAVPAPKVEAKEEAKA